MKRIAVLLVLLLPASAAAKADPARFVNPFNGTQAGAADYGTGGGAGNTFPGATAPFGMVQFSPDTSPSIDAFGGGYSYVDAKIKGFGLKHMSGPGCAAYEDVPIMPTTQPVEGVARQAAEHGPRGALHDGLRPRGRIGRARRLPRPPRRRHRRRADGDHPRRRRRGCGSRRAGRRACSSTRPARSRARGDADVNIDPGAREISGSASSGNFCFANNRYRLYFAARFSRPFKRYGTWKQAADAAGLEARRRPRPGRAGDASTRRSPAGRTRSRARA